MATTENENLVLAYRTADSVEARSLAAQLEDAEIETRIVGDFRDTAYPGLFLGSMPDKELWISARDRSAGEQIVDQWRQTYHAPKPESAANPQVWLQVALIVIVVAAASYALHLGMMAFDTAFTAIPYLLFVYFAGSRLLKRRRTNDDEEPTNNERMNQNT